MNIIIEDNIHQIAPEYIAGIVEANVVNAPTPKSLWLEIVHYSQEIRDTFDVSTIKERSGIKTTRMAYKKSGVDPSRYRPSCEQLCRRILQGKDLYSIDTLVDIGNLLSMYCGYSVAVVDAEKIQGHTIKFGIGMCAEPYEAIGRGMLNIEGLPVWRDELGAFATPTSDNVRTMCSDKTRRILVIINAFDGNMDNLNKTILTLNELLRKYACCTDLVHSTW